MAADHHVYDCHLWSDCLETGISHDLYAYIWGYGRLSLPLHYSWILYMCSWCQLLSYKADTSSLLDHIDALLSECREHENCHQQQLIIR